MLVTIILCVCAYVVRHVTTVHKITIDHCLQEQISEEAVAADDAAGNTVGMIHKRIQKMTSTGTVNKPVEKKPLSQVCPLA